MKSASQAATTKNSKIALHVDEHRQVIAADRDLAALHAVELGRDLVRRQVVRVGRLLRERLVLVLGKERRLVLKLEVHRVLDGRSFVVVEPLGPGDTAPSSIASRLAR
ncbi:MAG: hypothetical protein KatS3mg082_1949 [Nitrospiraceae bacterium]|nr:MAG: hypothetical protein KatS3mg082_1949 [Nitrospiraceae bacterium]